MINWRGTGHPRIFNHSLTIPASSPPERRSLARRLALPSALVLLALIAGLWIARKSDDPVQQESQTSTSQQGGTSFSAESATTRRSSRPVRTHFPDDGLPQEFVDHFNIASIRSSVGPRLVDGKNRLADYLPSPPRIEGSRITYGQGEVVHEFTIIARGDFTHDGLEDLQIRHLDRGTRNPVISTFVVTRRSPGGAISFLRDDETLYPAGGNGEIYRIDHHTREAFDREGKPVDH